ncbi:prepilin peptidase [Nocardioides sp. zg-579]|uniref:Prepilin peptidase n=1 Tax=Nocardioides marmotae TaxID=2663857 RepID=A0A6I3JHK2_9ACTN|nr:A24 family peptidase [Nocardioides marmotae]MCR6033775.1 prepilin peptidase [Gordonia jinghuaiqii]MTB97433.1 prepilin peptidase [Nocardioides marmotae]QKE01747.1 prepilin peptidase [Nocardioides marmotae]
MSDPGGAAAAAGALALLCGALGLLVPALVARIPEPEPSTVHAGADGADRADGADGAGLEEEPKEAYADIARSPGLAWKAALASAVAGAVVGWAVGADWDLLPLVPLVPVSVALAVVDWRTRLLPTKVIAPTYLVTIALTLLTWLVTRETDDLVRAFWGWLVAGGIFFALWFVHPRGLGYGDVRLAGLLGIALGHLGWGELLVGVYGGFLLGGLGGGLLSLLRVVERRAFPFGPFMLLAALLGIWIGAPVLDGLATG